MAGLWTDFGVAASIRQARNLGYEVFIVVDACGDVSLRAHQIAIQSILQGGGGANDLAANAFGVTSRLGPPRGL